MPFVSARNYPEILGNPYWFISWVNSRINFQVPASELLASNCNLDRKNPSAKEDITHLPPDQLAQSILEKELRIVEILGNIKGLLAQTK